MNFVVFTERVKPKYVFLLSADVQFNNLTKKQQLVKT